MKRQNKKKVSLKKLTITRLNPENLNKIQGGSSILPPDNSVENTKCPKDY